MIEIKYLISFFHTCKKTTKKVIYQKDNKESDLLKKLDEWIQLSGDQSKVFSDSDMPTSSMTSAAMKVAYNNVKEFIKNKL